ncbi:NBS-LRR type resistance protein [Cucumis melo var. makuwa]|uniref:NBS-LRR type resistance protein n=1 Tax=Cucumis melo var. makuwa TaxID=1194695 RepID=A0A5D3DYT8_CUCMM|nr:NBS-LRR type resistance protein [Cucumis melo var. makuwa]
MKITSNKIHQRKHKENQTRPYGLHASFLPLVGLPLVVPLSKKLKRKRGEYKIYPNAHISLVIPKDARVSLVIPKDTHISLVISKDANIRLVITKDANISQVIPKDAHISLVIPKDAYISQVILKDTHINKARGSTQSSARLNSTRDSARLDSGRSSTQSSARLATNRLGFTARVWNLRLHWRWRFPDDRRRHNDGNGGVARSTKGHKRPAATWLHDTERESFGDGDRMTGLEDSSTVDCSRAEDGNVRMRPIGLRRSRTDGGVGRQTATETETAAGVDGKEEENFKGTVAASSGEEK